MKRRALLSYWEKSMKSILFSALLALVLAGAASAQQPAAQPATPGNGSASASEKYFTDITLVNQNG